MSGAKVGCGILDDLIWLIRHLVSQMNAVYLGMDPLDQSSHMAA